MASGWTPGAAGAIGSRRLNTLFKRVMGDIFSSWEYRTFADMIAHAADPAIPITHTHWELRKSLDVKIHLPEIPCHQAWASLIIRLDPRAVRAPWELRRIRFGELNTTDLELTRPDMHLWLWQAAKQGISPNMESIPFALYAPRPGRLILSRRADHIDSTKISLDYTNLRGSRGAPGAFEKTPERGEMR